MQKSKTQSFKETQGLRIGFRNKESVAEACTTTGIVPVVEAHPAHVHKELAVIVTPRTEAVELVIAIQLEIDDDSRVFLIHFSRHNAL